MARRSRGTPRIANRLLRRVRDFSEVDGKQTIDLFEVEKALSRLEIDKFGLDRTDRDILRIIYERYHGGPVGLDTLAVSVGEEKATIEEVYEPYLVFQGFLARGPRGRILTDKGRRHIEDMDNGFSD